MMKKKYVLRTVKVLSLIFAVLICVGVGQKYIFTYYDNNKTLLTGYYQEPKDTIDVVLLGASDVFCDFSPAYAYEQFQFTSYSYAVDSSPITLYKFQIDEIKRTQNPKIIVVEINGALYDSSENLHKEENLRRYIDSIPFSMNKCRTIFDLTPCDEWVNYFFPIIKYHRSNIIDPIVSSKDILNISKRGYSLLKGNFTHTKKEISTNWINIKNDYSCDDLEPESEKYLRDLLEYCKTEEMDNIVFARFPHIIPSDDSYNYERFKRCNEAEKIIKSYGFDFINLERNSDLIGLDYENDFYNNDHLNIYGQQKFTEYFGNLLMNDYGITKSILSDEVKKNWDISAEYNDLFYEYCESKMEEGADVWPYETSDLIQELDKLKVSKQ